MLVSDLILEAFFDLNAIAVGEQLTTAEQADAFTRLNQLLGQLSTEQLSVPNMLHSSFNLTGSIATYTLGPAGTMVTTVRPMRVTGASAVFGGFRAPIEILSFDDFSKRVGDVRGVTAIMPELMAADNGFPSINLRFHPTPAVSPATVWLDYWIPVPSFATVGDTVNLPPGWETMLHWNLALNLFAQYARPGNTIDVVMGMAQSTKASVVANNAAILGMQPAAQAQQKGG